VILHPCCALTSCSFWCDRKSALRLGSMKCTGFLSMPSSAASSPEIFPASGLSTIFYPVLGCRGKHLKPRTKPRKRKPGKGKKGEKAPTTSPGKTSCRAYPASVRVRNVKRSLLTAYSSFSSRRLSPFRENSACWGI